MSEILKSKLDVIDQKLETIRLNINYEKEQILKAKQLLERYQKSLIDQTRALGGLRENEPSFVNRISSGYDFPSDIKWSHVESMHHEDRDIHHQTQSVKLSQSLQERMSPKIVSRPNMPDELYSANNERLYGSIPKLSGIKDSSINICNTSTSRQSNRDLDTSEEGFLAKRKISVSDERDDNMKVNIWDTEPKRMREEIEEKPGAASGTGYPMVKLPFTQIANKTINQILLEGDIVVCGNAGILLKFTEPNPIDYNTSVNDDIIRIITIVIKYQRHLVAFTKQHILFFRFGNPKLLKRINLSPKLQSELVDISEVKNDIFLSFKGGVVKRIVGGKWKLYDEPLLTYPGFAYFPASVRAKTRLITYENDINLYSSSKPDLSDRAAIAGLSNVTRVLQFYKTRFLCISYNYVWLIDQNAVVLNTLEFTEGVNLVARDAFSVVVVDNNGAMQVHRADLANGLLRKVCEQQLQGTITALAISDQTVYVAVDRDAMYTIHFDV